MLIGSGSEQSIKILQFMREKPFTKAELSAFLEQINFSDAFQSMFSHSSIDRMMNSIRKGGYATFTAGRWHPNIKTIDIWIDLYRKDPEPSAAVKISHAISELCRDRGVEVPSTLQ